MEGTAEQSGQMKASLYIYTHIGQKKHGERIFERICQKLELYTADEAEPEVAQNFYPLSSLEIEWRFDAVCCKIVVGGGGRKKYFGIVI